MADEPAVDIGEAIQRGVELLAQQSVETPKFKLATVADLYREGVRATKSRAPAARVLEAWSDAAAEMPAPLPMAIERAGIDVEDEDVGVAESIALPLDLEEAVVGAREPAWCVAFVVQPRLVGARGVVQVADEVPCLSEVFFLGVMGVALEAVEGIRYFWACHCHEVIHRAKNTAHDTGVGRS